MSCRWNEDHPCASQHFSDVSGTTHLLVLLHEQLRHEESVRDEPDPGECEPREEHRLQRVDRVTEQSSAMPVDE